MAARLPSQRPSARAYLSHECSGNAADSMRIWMPTRGPQLFSPQRAKVQCPWNNPLMVGFPTIKFAELAGGGGQLRGPDSIVFRCGCGLESNNPEHHGLTGWLSPQWCDTSLLKRRHTVNERNSPGNRLAAVSPSFGSRLAVLLNVFLLPGPGNKRNAAVYRHGQANEHSEPSRSSSARILGNETAQGGISCWSAEEDREHRALSKLKCGSSDSAEQEPIAIADIQGERCFVVCDTVKPDQSS